MATSETIGKPGNVKQVILHTVQKLSKNDIVKLEGRGTEDAICLNQSQATVYYEGRLVYST